MVCIMASGVEHSIMSMDIRPGHNVVPRENIGNMGRRVGRQENIGTVSPAIRNNRFQSPERNVLCYFSLLKI